MLCLGVTVTMTPAPARASMIGTEQMVAAHTRADDLSTVTAFMSRDQVASEFEKMGVDPVDAQNRVASLSDEELSQLAQHVREQPAGGDALLAVIGLVFVILIILELVGVTHIFNGI
nr:PA2779 family protein [Solimonas terrae]